MLLRHPSYHGKIIAVLEGETDIRLFRSLLNEDHVKIESAVGRANVGNIVCDLSEESEFAHRLFGICDADFARVLAEDPQCEGIFFTDSHDAEIMMINSPAVQALISEYAADAEAAILLREGLVPSALNIAFQLSILRYVNHLYDLNINFKGLFIDFYLSINTLEMQLDVNRLCEALVERSPTIKVGTSAAQILAMFHQHVSDSSDQLQMCNGHDVTKIISYVLAQRKLSNDININQEKVERSLRLSYASEYFKKTELYQSLTQWRDEHSAPAFLC